MWHLLVPPTLEPLNTEQHNFKDLKSFLQKFTLPLLLYWTLDAIRGHPLIQEKYARLEMGGGYIHIHIFFKKYFTLFMHKYLLFGIIQ